MGITLVSPPLPTIRFSSKERLQEFLDLVSENYDFFLGVDFLPRPDSVVINFKPRLGAPPAIRKWLDERGVIRHSSDAAQIRIVAACHLQARQILWAIHNDLERHLRAGSRVRGALLDRLWEITGFDVPSAMHDPRCVGV